MNPEQLLALFDRVSDAPGAIPRLRRFILDLAIRGKLVEQDPNDEPASELLKRIQVKREILLRNKKIKVARAEYGPISAGCDFDVPAGWARSTINETCDLQTGATPDRMRPDYFGGEIRWLVSGDVNKREVFDCEGRITQVGLDSSNCKILPADSVLMALNGQGKTRATVAILRIPAACNQSLVAIMPFLRDSLLPEYLFWNLRSRYLPLRHLTGNEDRRGLNMKIISCLAILVPPVHEQRRIVVRVGELMALCDRLETAQAERKRQRDRLTVASSQRLSQPNGADTFRRHAHFYLCHLPLLTVQPEQIQQLRQTILTLAIRGRLVPQDPKDEPVSELLKKIEAEKARLAGEGKPRGGYKIMPLKSDEVSLLIPPSWVQVSFGALMISRDGERIPVSKEERSRRNKIYDYYGASGVIDKIDGFLFDKPLLLIGEDGANLVNRSTPIAFIARGKYWVNNHAHALDGLSEGFLRYMALHINAIDLKPYVTGTAQPKMNQAKMNSIPISLPPEAEQDRIVAKVDELMILCDQVEAQLSTSQTESRRLLEAVLQEALATA
jgi:type I restriction enzyme, S subunit